MNEMNLDIRNGAEQKSRIEGQSNRTAGRLNGFAPFLPHPLVRQGDIQTTLSMIRASDAADVTAGEQAFLVDAGPDRTGVDPERSVRLLSYYTSHRTAGRRRGLVLLLHGWEGCSHSNCNLLVGTALIQAGFDVVRLNLRDHGPTHQLNRGLFYATLIDEAESAAQKIAVMAGADPFYIVGASLGGNFALRLALRWDRDAFPGLHHVISINPALNPDRTSRLLDRHPLYGRYFRDRWIASLQRKQRLFPDLYEFDDLYGLGSVIKMTEWLVKRFGPYNTTEEYFSGYAVTGSDTKSLVVPTTVLTAANDPIISADDFYDLAPHPLLRVHVHPSGGHVGYMDLFPFRHVLPDMVVKLIKEAESKQKAGKPEHQPVPDGPVADLS